MRGHRLAVEGPDNQYFGGECNRHNRGAGDGYGCQGRSREVKSRHTPGRADKCEPPLGEIEKPRCAQDQGEARCHQIQQQPVPQRVQSVNPQLSHAH